MRQDKDWWGLGKRNSRNTNEKSAGPTDLRKEDWGTHAEREDRIRRECGKRNERYYPSDDWNAEHRQAGDRVREEERHQSERKSGKRGEEKGTTRRCNPK